MANSRQYGAPQDPASATTGQGLGAQPYGSNPTAQEPKTTKQDPSPPGSVVTAFHRNADTDVRSESIHHTLGPRSAQASPGDHSHNGGTSVKLLQGYILTGSKATPATMWPSIIQCLVRLGAKDTTT